MTFALDVADADVVIQASDAIVRSQRSIDIWINNAMVTVFSPIWRMTPEEFRRVTEVTYLGAVHGTMAALRQISLGVARSGVPSRYGLAAIYAGVFQFDRALQMRGATDAAAWS